MSGERITAENWESFLSQPSDMLVEERRSLEYKATEMAIISNIPIVLLYGDTERKRELLRQILMHVGDGHQKAFMPSIMGMSIVHQARSIVEEVLSRYYQKTDGFDFLPEIEDTLPWGEALNMLYDLLGWEKAEPDEEKGK